MDRLHLFACKEKKRSLMIRRTFFFILICVLLSAYFLVISCGKKGPPTLKTASPPSESEHVDSNSGETTPEKPPAEP